jgi:sporulation and spore germination protein
MPRWRVWLIGMLFLAVIVAAIYFPILRRHLRQAAQVQQQSEEQARRELTQSLAANPGAPLVKAKLFWSSGAEDGSLTPVTIDLPLSKDPVLRGKQVLNTLLAGPADAELRTVPPDAVLLAFYLLPDGTAIADFSEALATSIPSGIASEQMAVDSLTKTLEDNVPQVRWLKILLHGQEVDTLAGHLDLTRTFLVNAKPAPMPSTPAAPRGAPGAAAPTAGSSASGKTPTTRASAPTDKLTPATPPGKLAQPGGKP